MQRGCGTHQLPFAVLRAFFEQVRDAMHNYTDLEIMQSTDGYLEIGAKDGTKSGGADSADGFLQCKTGKRNGPRR